MIYEYINLFVEYVNRMFDIYVDIINNYFEMCIENHIV